MAIDFQNVLATLKNGVVNLAEKDLKAYVAAATADGLAVLDSFKADLETWVVQLANNSLSKDDFEDLVLGQKDELEMVALKQAGLAEISTDQFKNDVYNLIITTLCAFIP